jgi:hypothetical protein
VLRLRATRPLIRAEATRRRDWNDQSLTRTPPDCAPRVGCTIDARAPELYWEHTDRSHLTTEVMAGKPLVQMACAVRRASRSF